MRMESMPVLRNLMEGGEGGVSIELVDVERADGGDMGMRVWN